MNKIYSKRRKKLLKEFKNDAVVVLSSAALKQRSNDTEFPFRQDSNFYYLSGFKEDNACMVLLKKNNKIKSYLFLTERNEQMELWTGERLGTERAGTLGFDKCFDIKTLGSKLGKYFLDVDDLYLDFYSEITSTRTAKRVAKTLSQGRTRSVKNFLDITSIVQKMRLVKDENEIKQMRKAVMITKNAHHIAMQKIKPNSYEYKTQARIEKSFKSDGAYWDAYTTIVASGNNANTLHYILNDKKINDGDLVLIDAGSEYNYYASDVTRTFPVNGKFTPAQKEVYEMVLNVQLRIIEMIKPGIVKQDIQDASERFLAQGMLDLGILKGDLDEILKEKKQKKYYPHGIGHWMGLDVHDPCPYRDDEGNEIPFAKGMILTIEPGIYLNANDKEVPKKYRGIGIRIEDDILVTKEGNENLSKSIVKNVEDIEALMA